MSFIKNMKPQVNGKYHQGYYRPVNPLKYIGDDKIIIYRSSLELKFCQFCDTDPSVIRWVSEPNLQIKYLNPFKRRLATYYPDFMVQFKSEHGTNGVLQAVIEIKAHSMINLPKNGDISKMSVYMKKNIVLNQAKKKAAEKMCAEKNMKYMVITEKSIFFKNR